MGKSSQLIQNFSLHGCRARGQNRLQRATSNPNLTDGQLAVPSGQEQASGEQLAKSASKEATSNQSFDSGSNRLFSVIAKFEEKIMKTERIK